MFKRMVSTLLVICMQFIVPNLYGTEYEWAQSI